MIRKASSAGKRQLSATSTDHRNIVDLLQKWKGTVMEIMAKQVPKESRAFFAARWGFVPPIAVKESSVPKLTGSTIATLTVGIEAGIPTSKATSTAAAEKVILSSASKTELGGKVHVAARTLVPRSAEGSGSNAQPSRDYSVQSSFATAIPHEIYGNLLMDLGYKKMYLTSVERLVRAPIWERQRILRPERAMAIAESKMKGLATPVISSQASLQENKSSETAASGGAGLPGVITLFQDKSDSDRTGIVDGQHRVAALMIMSERGAWDKAAHNIAVDVVPTAGEDEVCNLFTEINKSEPVKLVDMPGEGADLVSREALDAAVTQLSQKFPAMMKPSPRCKPPHLHKDNLRDDIFQSELMTRHSLHTSEDLFTWLMKANDALGRRTEAQWFAALGNSGVSQAALKKAKLQGLYLGLDKSWLTI